MNAQLGMEHLYQLLVPNPKGSEHYGRGDPCLALEFLLECLVAHASNANPLKTEAGRLP